MERNKARLADPAFSITGISEPTGLHYSWTWNISSTCAIHFVHLNLFPGRQCGSAANPAGEGTPGPGFPCKDGDLAWAENSLGFLESDLAAHAGPGVCVCGLPPPPACSSVCLSPHSPHLSPFLLSPSLPLSFLSRLTVSLQHYGFDPFSSGWYNRDQREELIATLSKYNPLVVLVGHTHTAEVYSYNGTSQAAWGKGGGFVDVVNAPATQKEDGKGNPLPSEFMAFEAAMDSPTATTGKLRVAQRVGSGWGAVQGVKSFQC